MSLYVSIFVCLLFPFQLFAQEGIPSYQQIKASYSPSDILYFDRHLTPIQSIRTRFDYRSENWIEIDHINSFLLEAVIHSEDKKFYEHSGVDSLAFVGSIWKSILGGSLRGGSTITMQLAGILDPELSLVKGRRNIFQKLKQIQRAGEIEARWSKVEILTAYLNLVFFRGELRGVGSASRALFHKLPSELNPNESYILTALIRSPKATISKVSERACVIKKSMEANEEVSCDELAKITKNVLFQRIDYSSFPNHAQHFVNLIHKMGLEGTSTTIIKNLQIKIEQILKANLKPLLSQMVDDGAVLVLHNRTGEVISYVANSGSMSNVSSLDLIQTKRQAGSTLKPFVYAQSFEERKLSPSSILNDAPIDIPVFRGIYRPLNYDKTYQGKVTVAQSLGSSLNIPAVRALSYLDMGLFLHKLNLLGFKNLAYPEFYGPSLALGSADVSLWELTNAYRTFANEGKYSDPVLTVHVESKNGNSKNLSENETVIFRKSVAFLIQSILSSREARSLSFGWESNLSTPFYSAVKTGTSQDMRDNWCIGFSSEYTVGVWIGNAKGQPMRDVSGVSGAGPIWREVMELLHEKNNSQFPDVPNDVVYDNTKQVYVETNWSEISDYHRKPFSPPLKISAPSNETIFAFDPDIPKGSQKILFRLNHYQTKGSWNLNGIKLGSIEEPFLWNLEKGIFVLEVMDENGKSLDKIHFEVR